MVSSAASVQWPRFTVRQPDPVLGDVYTGKAGPAPERTLVEFISTSAAFHGVKKQPLRSLESDLLKVFANNVMPANAAAWYMAKRKFYINEPFDQQLLPFMLKKFPEKFRILGNQVIFLEVYEREAGRQKLNYLVQAGLHAYFAHKAEEYGVYFFDPHYYEDTEPFHASLRQACPRVTQSQLVPRYFASEGMKARFAYTQHTNYLVSICKQSSGVKVVTGTTGVIVSMINSQYGFIKFGASEKALFCAKSLFKDGWQFSGDPLKLPAMKFDGYQIPREARAGGGGGSEKHSWYAVLVWCGRRPSPQHCSTTEDLNSTPVFRDGRPSQGLETGARPRQPSSSMCVGEVEEVRRDGAVLSIREDAPERVWVPGWRRKLANCPGFQLSSQDGDTIGLGDVVSYYVGQETKEGFSAVGRNVSVLKESDEKSKAGRRRRNTTEGSEATLPEVGRRDRAAAEDSDSEGDLTVSEGELDWLEKDLGSIIAAQDPHAKTTDLLVAVQVNLQGAIGRPGRRKTARKVDRVGYRPLPEREDSFWRMKKLLEGLASGRRYHSDSDPDYQPGDDVEEADWSEEEEDEEEQAETEGTADSSFAARDGRRRLSVTSSASTAASVSRAAGRGPRLPYWVRACSRPEHFDPSVGKFVPLDRNYREEMDPDYKLPETDIDDDTDTDEVEVDAEELELLIAEALEPLPVDKSEEMEEPVVSPVKVTLTPAKDGEEGPEEVVTLVRATEEAEPRRGRPALWVRELLGEELGEDEGDVEYVPPPTCLDSSLDYDEYSDGEGTVPPEEVTALVEDAETTLAPPAGYVAIWVEVPSAEERIARAKEQLAVGDLAGDQEFSKDETSGKDTDSNDKKPVGGGRPGERRKSVGRSCSEGDGEEPKPRRERKKSVKMDEVKEVAEVKVKAPEAMEAAGDTTPLILL